MTQKEQIVIMVKKINIMDEQMKYLRVLLDRIEDRVIALEEDRGTAYRETKDVIFESDWDADESSDDDEDN